MGGRMSEITINGEQYHAGLTILWNALGNPDMNDQSVYERIAGRIEELEAEVEQLHRDVHGQAQAKIQLGRLLHEEKAGTYK